jgi:hypothetical protein
MLLPGRGQDPWEEAVEALDRRSSDGAKVEIPDLRASTVRVMLGLTLRQA